GRPRRHHPRRAREEDDRHDGGCYLREGRRGLREVDHRARVEGLTDSTLRGASLLLLAAAWAAPAQAQPSAGELRAQLAQLRERPPEGTPHGTLLSIEYLIDTAERIDGGRFTAQAASWRARAARYLAAVREGRDPYLAE